MINHSPRHAFVPDTDSALARFVRATVAVQGLILDMEHIPARRLYYMSVLIPAVDVAEWLRLQEGPKRASNPRPKTRSAPAGCPLANDASK